MRPPVSHCRVLQRDSGLSKARAFVDSFNRHTYVVAAVIVTTIVAGVFAVLQYVAPRGPSSPPTDTSSSTTHEPGAAPTQPPSRSAPAAVTVGTCLNGSVPVACDSDHNAEVISLDGQCDSGLFARYAGGNSSVEVFRSSITFTQYSAGNQTLCRVNVGSMVKGSQQDALRSSKGDHLRQCLDDGTALEVPCNERHAAEVVWVRGAGDLSQLNCLRHASEYMGSDLGRYVREVEVAEVQEPQGKCLVRVRGRNVLTSSVRNIGYNAVPIEAMP